MKIIAITFILTCIVCMIISFSKPNKKHPYPKMDLTDTNLWNTLINDINNMSLIKETNNNTSYFNYQDRYTIIVYNCHDINNMYTAMFTPDLMTCVLSSFNHKKSQELAQKLMLKELSQKLMTKVLI